MDIFSKGLGNYQVNVRVMCLVITDRGEGRKKSRYSSQIRRNTEGGEESCRWSKQFRIHCFSVTSRTTETPQGGLKVIVITYDNAFVTNIMLPW